MIGTPELTWSKNESTHGDPGDPLLLPDARHILMAMNRADEAEPPVIEGDGWMRLGEGSEAEYRDDEVLCPVSNLTYYRGLKKSPYTDDEGKLAF